MKGSLESRAGVAALRPWPFGPPLRGRAPRSDAGPQPARSLGPPPQTTAPVGGLPCAYPHRYLA